MSNNLINITEKDGQLLVTSLEVAKNFEKNHADVTRSIKNLAQQNCCAKSLFYEATYENRGKQYPMYLMNRDGFSLLVINGLIH